MSTTLERPNTEPVSISRPPTKREIYCDKGFRGLTHFFAWATVGLLVFIVYEIGSKAVPAIKQHGLGFITRSVWDANTETYGILPQIWGTLYSSVIALIIGSVLGIAVAVFLSERFLSTALFKLLSLFGKQYHPFWGRLPDQMDALLKNLVELLAAIPSVVYGLWGIFVIIPLIRPPCLVARTLGLDSVFRHIVERPWHVARIVGAGDHDPADDFRDQPRRLGKRAAETARSSLWTRSNSLGSDHRGDYSDGSDRHHRFNSPGIWPGARRNDGLGDVGWQCQCNQRIALLTRKHFGGALANNFPNANQQDVGVLMFAALVLMAITLAVNIVGALVLQKSAAQTRGRGKWKKPLFGTSVETMRPGSRR